MAEKARGFLLASSLAYARDQPRLTVPRSMLQSAPPSPSQPRPAQDKALPSLLHKLQSVGRSCWALRPAIFLPVSLEESPPTSRLPQPGASVTVTAWNLSGFLLGKWSSPSTWECSSQLTPQAGPQAGHPAIPSRVKQRVKTWWGHPTIVVGTRVMRGLWIDL